jgi:nucleotide-binding universal stress UspA family protein
MKMLIAVEDKIYGKALADFVVSHRWKEVPEFKIVNVVEQMKYLIPPITGVSDTRYIDVLEERQRMSTSLVLSLGTTLRQSFPNATIDELVVDGDPKSKILDLAQEWEADLIVMGSHGRRGLERLFLGSVSLAVLSHALCSVMIVKLAEESAKSEVEAQSASKDKMKVSAK